MASIMAVGGDKLGPHLKQRPVRQGEVLVREGEPIDAVFFPCDAVLSRIISLDRERSLAVGLVGSEGFVGIPLLLGVGIGNANVKVEIPGEGWRMPAADFDRLIVKERGEAYNILLQYVNVFMGRCAQTAACSSLHGFKQRLASWLLLTLDAADTPELPVTHDFLANVLGVRRPTVSITANALRQKGLIEYHRGKLQVLNREALERISCDCYFIVRGLTQELLAQPAAV